jgi:hypothetical protein
MTKKWSSTASMDGQTKRQASKAQRRMGIEDDSCGDTCAGCKHFAPMKPGHAAICMWKWRGLAWNDAVPLTSKDDWCEDYERR